MESTLRERTYLEICTDNEDDWKTSLDILAKSFQNSAPFMRTHPDPEKRRQFLAEYFKYIYETKLSNDRSGLACVKLVKGGADGVSDAIIYINCCIYGKSPPKAGDKTPMQKIDAEAMELNYRQDEWVEEMIHAPLRRLSNELNFTLLYGIYHATANEYQGRGISKYYGHDALMALYKDGLRRRCLDENKLTFSYGIADDIRARSTSAKVFADVEIAHLHDGRPDGQRPACVDHPSYKEGEPYDCVFLTGQEMGGHTGLVEKLIFRFSFGSNI